MLYQFRKCAGENPGQILKISSGNKKTGDIFIIKRDSRTTGVISQVQCLIRGYGLLDDKESSEKVLNLVEEGLKTDYLNDSAKRELLQYQASALEKEEKKEEAANIYAEILEDETEPGKREELYKKMVQLYETAGRRDMASDTCIQGIKELGESEELKLTHIRLICADPAVNRDTCALKIKEYVTEDTELLENAEFKKLQKEYGIKAEGGNIWVGR